MLYIVMLFVVDSFAGFIIPAVFTLILIAMSHVPVKFIFRGLKPVFLIIAITFIFNLFMIKGETLWKLGPLTITDQGLHTGAFLVIRLVMIIIGSSLLTFTTKPMKLTDGIEYLLRPLSRFGVPVHDFAMTMTIALRFIPTLLEETDKIMKAQQSRGADFESGSLVQRAKKLLPIMIPLLVSALRIASDLAMAMEARCYGGRRRTRMNEMKMKGRDFVAAAVLVLFAAAIILQRIVM